MKRLNLKSLAVLLVVSVAGCAGTADRPRESVPVEERGAGLPGEINSSDSGDGLSGNYMPVVPPDETSSLPGDIPGSSRPAVIALLDSAERERRAGQVERAAAALERALRLEPKNALLWSRLAEVRLLEENWHQAYVLANKSNSLAQGNRELQRDNWRIIEQAMYAQGDMAAVKEARARIEALR